MKATIEYGGLKATFEGTPDEVLRGIIEFLYRVCEKYRLASVLIGTRDVSFLTKLEGLIKISEDEGVVFLGNLGKLSIKEQILLLSGLKRLEYQLNLSKEEGISVRELCEKMNASPKTVSARITELCRSGLLQKAGKRGVYRLTIQGVARLETKMLPKLLKLFRPVR